MKIIKFITNVQNQEAIAKVASFLDQEESIKNWKIDDTDTEENILSVSGENLHLQQIENTVEQAGYQAEILRVVGTGGEGL